MRRPSHWILAFTALAGLVYLALPRAAEAPAPGQRGATEPVVVRRTAAEHKRGAAAALHGRVLDRLGWPLRGAKVTLLEREESVAAGEDGAFRLVVATFERHRVRVEADGKEPQEAWMHPHDAPVLVLRDALPWRPRRAAESRADKSALSGEGFLRDAGGEPVADGVVAVVETGVRGGADETGRYRITLPEGPATLVAYDARGRVARSELFHSPRRQGLVPLPDLLLRPGPALRGYLRDPQGKPCAGASLCVRGQGVRRTVQTDAGGAFECLGLLAGDYVIEALPHRGALGFERQVAVDRAVDLDLTLASARPLRVEVVEDSKGPLPKVHVLAEEGALRQAHAVTNDEGRVELAGLGPGPFVFEVRAGETYAPYAIAAFDEDESRLTVRTQ